MKLNRIILVSILLLIFTIGAVSAADENITDQSEEVLSAEPIDEVLSSEPVEELEATQPEDFSELVTLIKNTSSGKTLILDKDYVNDGTYTKGILISKKMTIDGQGHTLDADNKSNIFRISNNQVTLKNINFINSYSKDYSAVYGNCTIINCTFTDCTTEYRGGALYNGTAYNSTFINCGACYDKVYRTTKNDPNLPYCEGGAIYNGDAYNCYFENCYAEFSYIYTEDLDGDEWEIYETGGYGGAISNGNAFNSLFKHCYINRQEYHGRTLYLFERGYGGGIYSGNAYNSTFIECTSWSGGAISNGDAYDCYFDKCYLDINPNLYDSSYGYGVVIYQGNSYNSTFKDCYAYTDGAIHNGNAYNSIFINFTSGYEKVIINGNSTNCIFIPDYFSPSDLIVDYGEGGKLPIRTVQGSEGLAVNVRIYKDSKLVNSFSTTTGTDLPIDLAIGNYIVELTSDFSDPLNISLVVNKGSPHLAFATDFAKSGETAKVKVTLSKKATGFVRIIINGVTYRVQVNSGVAIAEVPNLADGVYDVKATYSGNAYHTPETITGTFQVGKLTQGITLEDENILTAERLTAHLAKGATGFVRFIVGGETYKVAIENGTSYVDIENLKTGTYTVTLKYGGNYRYNAETITKTIDYRKLGNFAELKSLISNTSNGETLKLEKDYMNDTKSSAITISKEITIDGQGHTIDANNNSYIFYVNENTVVLKNINFINSYAKSYSAVFGSCTIINCTFTNCYNKHDSGDIWMGGGAINCANAYNCTFTNCYADAWGGAICWGDAYNCTFIDCRSDDSGGAIYDGYAYNCTFINCHSDNGNGEAICYGNAYDSIFIDCSESGKEIIDQGTHTNCIFIPDSLSCSNLTVNYGEGGKLPIRTVEGSTGLPVKVQIYKNNKLINSLTTTTGSDLPIDAAPGNYIIALTSDYTDPLNVSLTVNKGSPKLALANDFAKSGETANVKVTMSKKATGFVKITINGATYRVQVNSGVAIAEVPNLADGTYEVKATYAGNTYHTAETMTATFQVGKMNQGINLSAKSINVGETERITATLAKDATGFVRFIIGTIPTKSLSKTALLMWT